MYLFILNPLFKEKGNTLYGAYNIILIRKIMTTKRRRAVIKFDSGPMLVASTQCLPGDDMDPEKTPTQPKYMVDLVGMKEHWEPASRLT